MQLIDEAVAYAVPVVAAETRETIRSQRPLVARMLSPLLIWLLPIIVRLAIEVVSRWLRDRTDDPKRAVEVMCDQTSPSVAARLERYDG